MCQNWPKVSCILDNEPTEKKPCVTVIMCVIGYYFASILGTHGTVWISDVQTVISHGTVWMYYIQTIINNWKVWIADVHVVISNRTVWVYYIQT